MGLELAKILSMHHYGLALKDKECYLAKLTLPNDVTRKSTMTWLPVSGYMMLSGALQVGHTVYSHLILIFNV